MPHAVLIIEDEPILAKNIKAYLARYGYESKLAFSGEEGLAAMSSFQPGVVLLDYHLPNLNGLQVLEQLRNRDPGVKVIMITGHGSVEVAVQAMKAGACNYLSKPVVLCELKLLLDKAIEGEKLERNYGYLREKEARSHGLDQLAGESAPMVELKESLRRLIAGEYSLADNDTPSVLIMGETGTGKELVARALHFEGQRRSQPFIEINCAAMPAHLLEAELFGYERGAFTDAKARKPGLVEAAEGGTLFLDEIGEAELSFQSKLLKVLEEKKVRRLGGLREIPINFRVIAATNQDLERRVYEGKFRSDLYFRLRMMPLYVPPLRERGQDVLLLARNFLKLHGARYRKPGLFLTSRAELALLAWPWPGNVRELRNTLEHVVLMAQADAIDDGQLAMLKSSGSLHKEAAASALSSAVTRPVSGNPPTDGLNLEKLERECLMRALHNTAWNVTQAAKLLGLSRDTLRYRMEKHGLKNMQ
jgi:two-component system response regulator AtoC